MSFLSSKKVSAKFINWNIPLFVLFFGILCAIIFYVERGNQFSSMKNLGAQTTEQTAVALENWIDDQIRIAKMIASDARVIAACKNPTDKHVVELAHDYLKLIHKQFPYYENLPLAAKLDSNERFSIVVEGKEVTINDGAFFTDTVGGKTIGKCGPHFSYIKAIYNGKDHFISEVYPSILRGNPIFVISAPVRDENAKLIGVTVIAPQMSYFTNIFVDKLRVGKTGYMFFLDDRGLLISHPDKKMILNKDSVEKIKHISSRILAGEKKFNEFFEGVKKLYVSRKINIDKGDILHDWYLVFTQANSELIASSNQFLVILAGVGALFILIYVIGTLFSFRSIIEKPIRKIANDLEQSSQQVASGSKYILFASQSLTKVASEQASSIEEISSSLEELASMTKQNANHATLAEAETIKAEKIIHKVNAHMEEMINAVDEITRSSDETQKIVKTIDEIAFQTNLLALNAAVEAARAGEAGAGFAVVADEVRNLAMRAAEAAKNTAELIESTITAVKKGNELTGLTQDVLNENIDISKKINELVDQITSASNEQAQGIDQVNTAINEISRITQDTAASAEETSSSSQEMQNQSEKMKRLVKYLLTMIHGGKAADLNELKRNGAKKTIKAPDIEREKNRDSQTRRKQSGPQSVYGHGDYASGHQPGRVQESRLAPRRLKNGEASRNAIPFAGNARPSDVIPIEDEEVSSF